MFEGTIRNNLDPLEEYTDAQIWEVYNFNCLLFIKHSLSEFSQIEEKEYMLLPPFSPFL
jgi:ABC-type multidrug transport system fused ATPase/permease subunit